MEPNNPTEPTNVSAQANSIDGVSQPVSTPASQTPSTVSIDPVSKPVSPASNDTTPTPAPASTPASPQAAAPATPLPAPENLTTPEAHFAAGASAPTGQAAATPAAAAPTGVATPGAPVNTQPTIPAGTAPEGWNWGAFFLNWIWAAFHHVWIGLLGLIPIIQLPIGIYLGLKGHQLAWQNNKYESLEKYKAIEKKWAIWGWVVFGLSVIFTALCIIAFITLSSDPTVNNAAQMDLN